MAQSVNLFNSPLSDGNKRDATSPLENIGKRAKEGEEMAVTYADSLSTGVTGANSGAYGLQSGVGMGSGGVSGVGGAGGVVSPAGLPGNGIPGYGSGISGGDGGYASIHPDVIEMISRSVSARVIKDMTESFSRELGVLKQEVEFFKQEIAKKDAQIERLIERVEETEQYSRRNSVRISGIAEKDGENCDDIVNKVIGALGADLKPEDIDRSHRVGRKVNENRKGHRSIIVKLVSYKSKKELMSHKKKLKNDDVKKAICDGSDKIFINDDLTKDRAAVAAAARRLKKDNLVTDTWVYDGVIFLKKGEGDRAAITRITTMKALNEYCC